MQERILIIGNGGREYAIGRVLKEESRVEALFFAPGNGATHLLGTNLTYEVIMCVFLVHQKQQHV